MRLKERGRRYGFVQVSKISLGLLLLLVSLFLGACQDDKDSAVDQNALDQATIEEFVASDSTLGAQYDQDTGLAIIILNENSTGQLLKEGDIIEAYYEVNDFSTGVTIDLMDEDRGLSKMLHGQGAVYPVGFDEALSFMKVGDKFRFLVPSDKGYGDIEIEGLISANAILDVTIEVVNILSEQDQLQFESAQISDYIVDNELMDVLLTATGIYIEKNVELDSGQLVGVGESVEITYTGTFLSGTPFDATFGEPFPFDFGTGEVIRGLDLGIGEMAKGEQAIIIIPSDLGYGGSVRVIPSLLGEELAERNIIPEYASIIGPYTTLVFEIVLLP